MLPRLHRRPIVPTAPTHVFATYRCGDCGWVFCCLSSILCDLDDTQCASRLKMTAKLLRAAPIVPVQEVTVDVAFDEETERLENASIFGHPPRFQS